MTNRIEIEAEPLGTVAFAGPGPAAPATSSAVLGDLLAIARGAGSTWAGLPSPAGSCGVAAMSMSRTRRRSAPAQPRRRAIGRYLPITDATPELTLGEGFTPLVRLGRIGERIGLSNLYVKVEGQNPTGSFKDRGMVVAVAKALEDGARAIICASTGNTSASAAAYGAARRPRGRRRAAAGPDRDGQAAPGARRRCPRRRRRRQLRRGAAASSAPSPSRTTTR